ncbi:MAG: amino acid adenylation domain-containing protein [Nocardioides sp.]|uniref:amino acid adenylation domain-containing protein n=1 Tax=Nocardioides sp. TaxID=35761 RepID=UPI0023A1F5BE|nr:amino acid adenylation domain-containing protein [Nocardioides sp.]MDE0775678.1 amino acid adenylation domain-containing protein [Nocardioides sp.]
MSGPASLVSAFEAQTRATPDAVAVDDEGQLITYAELDGWADAVCADLLAAGVAPGELVGIQLPRDSSWIAAIIGVLKAGCGYVPLDPLYPVARLSSIAQDAGLTVILGEASDLDLSPQYVALAGADATRRPTARPPVGPDTTAYVLYTSGSSGRPKGVPIRHRSVLALVRTARARMDLASTDVWSLFHSFAFDVSVWEMWGALLTGARVAMVPQPARIDPAAFVAYLVASGVTRLGLVPSVFRHLLASGVGPQEELMVREVVFAGEAVDPSAVSAWLATLPEGRRPVMLNMYGITEATVHVTLHEMTAVDFGRIEPGTLIGTPLGHARMRLVDPDLLPVADGDLGEILLDGEGVTEGYLGQPELNRERFVTVPGEDGTPVRCFRTGDLGSWDAGRQSYVCHGRLDHQVKVHGHRIELGDVEASLRACPGVVDAVVVLHRAEGRDATLLAYVVSDAAGETGDADTAAASRTIRKIRQALAVRLPRYMVPQHIKLVTSLPRTESGKTHRGGLVPPASGELESLPQ